MNWILGCLRWLKDFVVRKASWVAAVVLFWTIWSSFPAEVVGWYDVTLWMLKGMFGGISYVVPGAHYITGLLDSWVQLVKLATGFFKSYGGIRVELVLRTLAFEGILFWWQVKWVVYAAPKLPRWLTTGRWGKPQAA